MKEIQGSKEVNSSKYYFPVVFEKREHGYAVRVVGIENILTAGDTLEEAEKNAKEAIEAHISEMDEEELSAYTTPPEEVSVKLIEISRQE